MYMDQPARQPSSPMPAEPHEPGPPVQPRPACDCRRDGAGFCYHAMIDVLGLVEPARP